MIVLHPVGFVRTPTDFEEITHRFKGQELIAALMAWNLAAKLTEDNPSILEEVLAATLNPDDPTTLSRELHRKVNDVLNSARGGTNAPETEEE